MAQQLVDRRDLDFVIWEQMEGETHLQDDAYQDYNRKTCDLVLKEARALAIKELLPTMKIGDEEGVEFDKGAVRVPESFRRPFDLMKEGEWTNLRMPPEMGGQGAPPLVGAATAEYFMAANWAVNCYATMGNGTALLIEMFGTPEQKKMYVQKLTSAEWGGTMLLTEAQAGSDVGALTTTAERNPDGTYTLSGNKIFITCGEQDLTENIIHPVLARIKGDPAGTKGISIFIVPKYLVNPDGSLGEKNDIVCTGVEEKHGIHGSATCSMALGSKGKCTGYLLGEEKEGMKIMFYMMNDARLSTGLQGLACASAAYLLALNYARERIQGRDLADFQNKNASPVAIIKHPDVRRNLLWMKSIVDSMRSFFYYSTLLGEKALRSAKDEDKQLLEAVFSLLTPMVKDYLAVKGHDVCIQAMQVYGGAGYTKDYLVEQYARDCKIASIYEGTSGIQAMDLLSRKIGAMKGAAFTYLLGEIQKTIAEAKTCDGLALLGEKLETAVGRLGEVTLQITGKAVSPEFKTAFAHALPYLYVLGDTLMAWMLLWRAVVASKRLEDSCKKKDTAFYNGQLKTAEFFIQTELPVTLGKMDAIAGASAAAIEIEDTGFGGM